MRVTILVRESSVNFIWSFGFTILICKELRLSSSLSSSRLGLQFLTVPCANLHDPKNISKEEWTNELAWKVMVYNMNPTNQIVI